LATLVGVGNFPCFPEIAPQIFPCFAARFHRPTCPPVPFWHRRRRLARCSRPALNVQISCSNFKSLPPEPQSTCFQPSNLVFKSHLSLPGPTARLHISPAQRAGVPPRASKRTEGPHHQAQQSPPAAPR
jgi:hypothetical protein